MRIIVLGGAGMVGREVVRDLARHDAVRAIGVGDRDLEGARAEAASAGDRAAAVAVDVMDPAGLVRAVQGYDVVVNTVGPFYRNGTRVLDACLEARAHYVDVCDDYDAAERVLGYNARCLQAGITAITASGASPGITNMLGLLGTRRMEHAEEIHTAWVENIADAGGYVVWWHGMHMAAGEVPQFLDGQSVRVPALSGCIEVDFGPPLGRWPVYYVGHPEPVTLPRFVPGLRAVTNRGNIWPAEAALDRLLKVYNDLGLLTTDTITIGEVSVVKRDFTVHHLMGQLAGVVPAPGPGDPHFALRVDVHGTTDGLDAHVAYRTHVPDTSVATGISASYCAQQLGSGAVPAPGVLAPEACIEPIGYFRYLGARGMRFTETRVSTAQLEV